MLPKKGKKLHQDRREGEPQINFPKRISEALRTEVGASHRAVKTIMRWTGASERMVKYWLAGTHGPSGEHLVALARYSNEVLKVFLIMAERRPTASPAALSELKKKLLETAELIESHL